MAPSPSPRAATGWLARVQNQAIVVGGFVAVLWAIELIDQLILGGYLDRFGIRPRTISGLAAIPAAPFLHANFAHLLANTLPLAILAFLVSLRSLRDLWAVTAIVTVLGGLGVWAIGGALNQEATIHLGASTLIFGYFGFLVFRAYFERSLFALVAAFVVVLMYGGAMWGVLPTQPGVSWEGHLCGFLAGITAARVLARRG